MRVATFNILNGRTPTESMVDEERYAGAIASLDADVLALQEVDRNQPRSGGVDLTAVAAEAMGAVHHRFEPALLGTPGSTWSPASGEQDGGPAYGIALLSRYPVLGWQAFRLPQIRTRAPYLPRKPLRLEWVQEEPRVALLAELETPLGRMRVVTTHLSFLPWWNGHQLRTLVRRIGPSERADGPHRRPEPASPSGREGHRDAAGGQWSHLHLGRPDRAARPHPGEGTAACR